MQWFGTVQASVLAVIVGFGGAASAQEPSPKEPTKEVEELRATHLRLERARLAAMAQPKIKKSYQALQDEIEGAMVKTDPKLQEALDRFNLLEPTMNRATQTGDAETLRKFAAEFEKLGKQLRDARAAILKKRPHLGKKAEAFQAELLAAMRQFEPEADQLKARAEVLTRSLNKNGGP